MRLIEGFKHSGGDAGVFQHAGADDGDLGDAGVDVHVVKFQGILVVVKELGAGHDVLVGDGEDDILALVVAEGLDDHVHVDLAFGKEVEELIGNAWDVLKADQSKAGDLFILRHAGNVRFFHVFHNLLYNRTGVSGKAGEHLQRHAVAFCQLNRAVVQNLRAHGRKLQHFVIGDFLQLARLGNDARITGIDAVHIGIDLADVRLKGNRQCNGRRVRAAAAERRHVAVAVDALKARNQNDALFVHFLAHAVAVDLGDARGRVIGVGLHADLPAAQRHHGEAQLFDGHGHQRDGNLLAAGQKHVHLAARGVGIDLRRLVNQIVGRIALRRKHDADAVSLLIGVRDDFCHTEDPLRVGNGASAEFLYNQCHCFPPEIMNP